MEYVNKLDNYHKDLFSKSYKERIEQTKRLFIKHEECINKPMVKCCVFGNTSTGKSTLINVLLEKEVLYEGTPEATSCVSKCQSLSSGNGYFEIYRGNICPNKPIGINEVKLINKTNKHFLKSPMDLNNHLDIFVNVPNNKILQKFLLIDSPGYDGNDLNAILNHCKCVDIIIFCFRAKENITGDDIGKINEVKDKIGKSQISFLINCCDECDSIDKKTIIEKLSPHLTGEDAIYFTSALEEKTGMLNNERHEEFKKFKKCLKKQKCLATITYRKVFGDLLFSVKELLDCLSFTNFQESRFSEGTFLELHEEIIHLIKHDITKYTKNDISDAISSYSKQANSKILNFIIKQLINGHNLNEEIINDKYFYKQIIQNETIPKPIFSWYEFGNKNDEMKKCFRDYFSSNLTIIQEKIEVHYSERVKIFLKDLETYKGELNEIIENIRELML